MLPGRFNVRADLARFIDYTLLRPNATTPEFDTLCKEAAKYDFWSVCITPSYVRHAAERLRGSRVKVCTVIGFPLGYNVTAVKLAEARRAVEDGAAEVDVVSNFGALKSGDEGTYYGDIDQVASYCRSTGTLLKVILECCYLTDDEKAKAARIAESAGADFVKTSTGFGPGGATVADVILLKRALTKGTRVKAAGGIGSLSQALDLVRAGADRLGTSHGVKIMEELPVPAVK